MTRSTACNTASEHVKHRPRIIALDTLRGFTIVSMVAFHTVYDLAYIYGLPLEWFTAGPAQELWRISISWVFLLLAGWMCALSRNNVRRGLIYAAAACAVWVTTTIAAVDTPVNFGILFCMAASTLLWAAVERIAPQALDRVPLLPAIAVLALAFLLTRGIPLQRYPVEGLAWLGFPSPAFASGDYYPPAPLFTAVFHRCVCGPTLYSAGSLVSHVDVTRLVRAPNRHRTAEPTHLSPASTACARRTPAHARLATAVTLSGSTPSLP